MKYLQSVRSLSLQTPLKRVTRPRFGCWVGLSSCWRQITDTTSSRLFQSRGIRQPVVCPQTVSNSHLAPFAKVPEEPPHHVVSRSQYQPDQFRQVSEACSAIGLVSLIGTTPPPPLPKPPSTSAARPALAASQPGNAESLWRIP
jgi:hypothetical protein